MKKFFIMMLMCVISVSVFAQGDYFSNKRTFVFINGHGGTLLDKPKIDGIKSTGTILGGSITIGYQFSDLVNVGVGIAPAYTEAWTKAEDLSSKHFGDHSSELPVFIQVRFDKVYNKTSPFGELRVGGIVGECSTGNIINENGPSAIYLNAGFGYRVKRLNMGISWTEEFNKDGHIGYICGTVGLVI